MPTKVMKFDSTSDYTLTTGLSNNSTNFSRLGHFTMEAWIKKTGQGSNNPRAIAVSKGGHYFDISSNLHVSVMINGSQRYYQTSHVPVLNEWTHYAMTYDGSYLKVYVNTDEVFSVLINGTAIVNEDLTLGRFYAGGYTFVGEIADVRLWDIARTSEEIKARYDRRLNGSEYGLIIYYPLNDNMNITNDYSGYSRYGINYNVTYIESNDIPIIDRLERIPLGGGVGGQTGQTVYTAPNGVIVTSSNPVWNNSNYYYMGYLFDDHVGTTDEALHYWLTSSSANTTLTFDFAPIANPYIKKIVVYPRTRNDASSNYRILGSNDNSSWSEIVPWVTTNHSTTPYGTRQELLINNNFRYYRFELTRNGDWGATLGEIEFYKELPSQWDFNYNGSVQEFIAPESGIYKLETWGAEGGRNLTNPSSVSGKGGYSKGELHLNKGEKLYVYVGGKGTDTPYDADDAPGTNIAGGWNGGGNGTNGGGGGGGATDIRKGGTALNNRIIVAGGAGGVGYNSGVQTGGYGGGLIGGTGGGSGSGAGGTQSSGYSLGQGGNWNHTNDCGGGGGGYYGGYGGSTSNTAGGGGSGYISPIITAGGTVSNIWNGSGKAIITYVTELEESITFTNTSSGRSGSIQTYIVPNTGMYRIEAYGAQGGGNPSYAIGGNGAKMQGDFFLNKDEVLQILVGQMGLCGSNTSYISGGGGGGTFVAKGTNYTNAIPLIIAGGGGGAKKTSGNQWNGYSAVISENGVDSRYSGGNSGHGGSRNGASSGQVGSGNFTGGFAGGGFYSDGGQGSSNSGKSGYAFRNGGQGGIRQDNGSDACGDGGFGGGGGGMHNQNQGGGGGGGYSGGGAGHDNITSTLQTGGGGGSYNIGSNQNNSPGVRTGHGLVKITSLTSVSIENGLSTPTIHTEDVTVTATLNSSDITDVLKYRILVNSIHAFPIDSDYESLSIFPVDINVTLENNLFNVGTNTIEIELSGVSGGTTRESLQTEKTNIVPYVDIIESNSPVHKENIIIKYSIRDTEDDFTAFKILINDELISDWSPLNIYSEPTYLVIKNDKLDVGVNVVRFELKDDFEGIGELNLNIIKESVPPTASIDYLEGYVLRFTINDEDGDKVAFKVSVNGVQQIPDNNYSDYFPVPYPLEINIDPNLVNMNISNNILIELRDEVGATSSLDAQVILSYPSLVFCDSNEEYYSNHIGDVLKILVHDTIVAGNTSSWVEVWIKNNLGYPVENVTLTAIQGDLDPIHEKIELTYPTINDEIVQTVNIGTLEAGEKKSFFIRVNADLEAVVGGNFYVNCKGQPVL
jgi:hypothetical protein